MRDHLRVVTLWVSLLALLAAGPSAAAANLIHASSVLTATDQDPSRSTSWLHGLWLWLEGVFASAGPEAAPTSFTYMAPASSEEPGSPDPGLDFSPQGGPYIDPDG